MRARIEATFKSIGRIDVPNHPDEIEYAGTGFVVGPDLVMTNRHVAEEFARSSGAMTLTIVQEGVAVEFLHERDGGGAFTLPVQGVALTHPYWDMALLRVDGLPADRPSLRFSTADPDELVDSGNREVVAIGYPGLDKHSSMEMQERIFRRIFGVKRLLPGRLRERRDVESYQRIVASLGHDCSTLAGASGSAVIDVTTGEVVGLHFGGEFLDMNFAVPALELARDSRVVDAGVAFDNPPPANAAYEAAWSEAEAAVLGSAGGGATPAGPHVQSTAKPSSWTAASASPTTVSVTIPLRIEISLGAPSVAGAAASPAEAPPGEHSPPAVPPPTAERRRPSSAPRFDFDIDALDRPAFSWPAALAGALACQLAYEGRSTVLAKARDVWRFDSCTFIDANETQCFVAARGGTALVAFRGTETLGDWIADLNVLGTSQPYGRVHRGFYFALEDARARLEQKLQTLRAGRVILTGHSLGGALATLAAAQWHGAHNIVGVYTYGQPRVGKADFAEFVAQRYPDNFYRFVNDDDVVTRIPPGYKHVGRLFHFDSGGHVEERLEAVAPQAGETEPPPLTMSEFDDLRARLLAQRAAAPGVLESARGEMVLEGFFPSASDHSIDRYVEKIAAQI
ncbi:MAG: trypsin-like peptidase domain-containing protein [Planctomycetales bacterium]|nr:trypsin-like peptidase domain-containing protein [Planctomycetales bacterium]